MSKYKKSSDSGRININNEIRASELRVISSQGDNLGLLSLTEALGQARKEGLDLIEISPNAKPPVAKIADYGRWKYEQSKKAKEMKAKSSTTETKEIQVKVSTGEHDLQLKAKKASEWIKNGDRVKIELYVRGRSKYMEKDFLRERLERVLKLLTVDYRVAEAMREGPKGFYLIVEKGKAKSE